MLKHGAVRVSGLTSACRRGKRLAIVRDRPVNPRIDYRERTAKVHPVHLSGALVDPVLEAGNLLLPDLASFIETAEVAVRGADVSLEFLDCRRQLAFAAFALHDVDELVDLGRAKHARMGCIVESEALDAEQPVVQ